MKGQTFRTCLERRQAESGVLPLATGKQKPDYERRMRNTFGNSLLTTSYSLFLAWYVFAAAAYGLTRDIPLAIFEWGMGGTFSIWLVAHILLRRMPRTGIYPWIAVIAVLAFGWFVTSMAILDDAITDDRLPGWDAWIPDTLLTNWSSYDAGLSSVAMIRTSVLLAAMLLAIDIWRDPRWARTLIATMLLSAFAMVVFFFLQRTFGGPFLLSDLFNKTTLTFATYRYWGNAASYLNLFWPLAVAVAFFAAIRKSFLWPLWFIPAAAVFAANFLNISKAGNVLAVIGAIALSLFLLPKALLELKRGKLKIRRGHFLGALIPIILIAVALPFAIPWKRWEYLSNAGVSGTDRPKAYAKFLTMLPDSGWIGFGPGTFQRTYRRYVKDDPEVSHTPYWVAHEDYLQTAIEWGYLGTALWAFVLIPGAVAVGWKACRKSPRPPRETTTYRITLYDHFSAFFSTLPAPTEPAFACGAFVAILLTALHSLVDFPMQIASLQLYFLALVALGWSYLVREKSDSSENPE